MLVFGALSLLISAALTKSLLVTPQSALGLPSLPNQFAMKVRMRPRLRHRPVLVDAWLEE